MIEVATLYIRNVPEDVYGALREQAKKRGTSISSEALEILVGALRWKRRSIDEVIASLEANAKEIGFGPDWPAPEDIIREDRDSH